MSLKVGELYAALNLSTDPFKKGLDGAHSHAKGWAGKIGGVFKTAGKAIVLGLGAALVAIAAIGKAAMNNAVEQERATARVVAAYGDQADAVEDWVAKSSKALGVNDDTLEISLAKYGDWAKNVGMSMDEAVKGGEEMAKRAAEIALATGKPFEEVFNGLFKGQQGMTRGLKEYGITVDKVALEAEAVRMGLIKEGEAMDAATQARARGNLIMQQTTQFASIAADMSDSAALKQMQMGATMDTIMDALGTVFLNLAEVILPTLSSAFSGLADWVVAHMPEIQAVTEVVMAAIGTAFAFVTDYVIPALSFAFDWVAKNIFPMFNQAAGTVSNDILPALQGAFKVVTEEVLPALGAAFDWVKDNILPPIQEAFKAIAENVLPILKAAFDTIVSTVQEHWPSISKIAGHVADAVKVAVTVIAEVIKFVAPIIRWLAETIFPILGKAVGFIADLIAGAMDFIGKAFEQAWAVGKTVVDALSGAWKGLAGVFQFVGDVIARVFRGAMNFLIGIVNGVIKAVNSIQVHIGRIGLDTPAGFIGVGPFDWYGLQLKELKYLAKGTPWFEGGWAMLGEQGPELARLPHGTQVFNAGQTRDMMGGGGGGSQGGGPMIGEQHIYGAMPGDVERETRRAIRRATLEWSLEGR